LKVPVKVWIEKTNVFGGLRPTICDSWRWYGRQAPARRFSISASCPTPYAHEKGRKRTWATQTRHATPGSLLETRRLIMRADIEAGVQRHRAVLSDGEERRDLRGEHNANSAPILRSRIGKSG
jgi:hypothetical protein